MAKIAKPATIPKYKKPGTLHSFFALKFHDGGKDKAKVEAIEKVLNEAGITITLMARDVEKWGKAEIPKDLIKPFRQIVAGFDENKS